MKLKQTIITSSLILCTILTLGTVVAPSAVADCGTAKTSIISCSGVNDKSGNTQDSAIWKLLIQVLTIMTAGVGILAVGGIVFGAILYTTAGDKPEQTKKAIGIITNVVIGIIAYGLMYLVLNFLIPGGIFN